MDALGKLWAGTRENAVECHITCPSFIFSDLFPTVSVSNEPVLSRQPGPCRFDSASGVRCFWAKSKMVRRHGMIGMYGGIYAFIAPTLIV